MFRAYCTSSILAIFIFALLIPRAVAQDTQHQALYGQGVHAYYRGDYESSVRYLTATISKNTDDPRSYYFRGLANAKLGNDEASLADLKKGAAIEALDDRGIYQISTALQRIQGQTRRQIETLRKQARLDLAAEEKKRLQARYEKQQRDEVAVLRKPVQTAPSSPADGEPTISQSNPFTSSNIIGIKSNPENVTSSKSNPIPDINDKDPLANVQDNDPAPANPTPGDNNPTAATPQAGGGGGTLGSIFRSLNPFGGNSGNAEPNAESTLDKLKKLIPGLDPAAPKADDSKAPGDNPIK
ncbi:MAG: hypothetical protein HOB73_10785 [Planctomycetaceae bacterium]|nr:hypothetical protein [Planctomycetaceae bacterium]